MDPTGVRGSGRRRGAGPRARRRVALAGVLALGVLGSSGCALDSPSLDVPAQPGATGTLTPAPASGVPSTYTGLGSRLEAFGRSHRQAASARGGAGPGGGGKRQVATSVTTNATGRVTGYVTSFNYRPPISDLERLALAVGLGDLPADRITITSTPTCLVYASPTMKRLVGMLYTRVLATPKAKTVEVRTTPTPGC